MIRIGGKSIKLTGGVIWFLESIYGKDYLIPKLNYMRTLPHGTVGYEIAKMLDSYRYRLIPKFESHDLKHIVLEYGMTMQDEIKMQTYLVGNGNYTFPCVAFVLFGIFHPKIWKELPKEFKRGRASKSIYSLTIDDCMKMQLADIKNEYGRNSRR